MEYFPGPTPLQFLKEIQDKMAVCQTSPENLKIESIFMSMFNDIDGTEKGNFNDCFWNS